MSLFIVNCGGETAAHATNNTSVINEDSSSGTTPNTPVSDIKKDPISDNIVSKEALGKSLFNDTNLSLNRTMSCATCHSPEKAFVDTRDNGVQGAVSLGDDGVSLGDRNAPTIGYAGISPDFNLDAPRGGMFFDGRAANLIEQAKGPLLNPIEMQMPDKGSVVDRVRENENYITSMKNIYGSTIFDDTDTAFNAIADAIAAFEKSNVFTPLDSAFDKGELTEQQQKGMKLFIDHACDSCHDLGAFTNFEYHNIGVPENTLVRALNEHNTDHGLLENPDVSDTAQDGKFKVPTLRNVAVTGPYMHNGIFKDLKTVIHFYNTRDVPGAINPETGKEWVDAEISQNITTDDNIGNMGMTDTEEDDMVAFLEALTDEKYEKLIP